MYSPSLKSLENRLHEQMNTLLPSLQPCSIPPSKRQVNEYRTPCACVSASACQLRSCVEIQRLYSFRVVSCACTDCICLAQACPTISCFPLVMHLVNKGRVLWWCCFGWLPPYVIVLWLTTSAITVMMSSYITAIRLASSPTHKNIRHWTWADNIVISQEKTNSVAIQITLLHGYI